MIDRYSSTTGSALPMRLIVFGLLLLLHAVNAPADHDKIASMLERMVCAELADLVAQQQCLDMVARRDYQVGDENGRCPVDPERLFEDSSYSRAVLATARVCVETAFYIGRLAGEHVAVTSRHVVTGANPRIDCSNWEIRFDFLLPANSVKCNDIIVSWPELDLALISLRVPSPEHVRLLEQQALQFDFTSPIRFGQPLLTAGYGGFGNDGHDDLMVNRDADCVVMSADATYRLRPADGAIDASEAIWSFAIGCDSSPGDSGSAVVDRATGRVIGVLWGGHTGKPEWVRNSSSLRSRVAEGKDDVVWYFLNYATPAPKIHETVLRDLREQKIDERTARVLEAWLSNGETPGVI